MRIPASLLGCVLILGGALRAASQSPRDVGQKPVVIVVVGAAGAVEYAALFAEWAELWRQVSTKAGAEFVGVGLDGTDGPSDRNVFQRVLAERSEKTATALWLVLIGHGTFDGRTAKFNLRGPDFSAEDLAKWLKPLERPVAVINTTSSSAPFLTALSSPGCVVVTATKSGFEQNFARFGGYLPRAMGDFQADLDKDGQTSLLEGFLTASHQVSEFYSAAGRLATEHALLDDNGDGLGTPAEWFRGIRPIRKARNDTSLDGYRAHQFHLVRSPAELAMPTHLRARRDQLELEVIKLRERKSDLSEAEYVASLEPLLRQIALIYEQVDPVDHGP